MIEGWSLFKMKLIWKLFSLAVVIVTAGGCYNYTPPPVATENDIYTARQKDASEELLAKISVLSLPEAQKISVKNNPNYISIYHAVNAARMRYYQSLGAYFPTITSNFNGGLTNNQYNGQVNINNPNTNNLASSTSLNANWLLFDGFIREMNVSIAKYLADNKRQLEENARRILLNSVAIAYNDILLAIEQQRIARADMEFQLKNLKETQLKYQAGAVPLSDVLNFKILNNTATGSQIASEYRYNIAVYSLSALMGIPTAKLPSYIKFPPINPDTDEHLTSVDVYLDTALNNRPDLKSFRDLVKVAQYGVYRSYGAYSPTVSAYGTLDYTTSLTRYGGGNGGINHTYNNNPGSQVGIQAELLMFDGLKRENIVREFKAELSRAKFEAASAWISIIQEVRGAYDNYVQNIKQAKLYEKTLLLVNKQRDLVEEEYRAGNTELTRLNEAQRNVVEADTNLVQALVNVRKARAQLDASTNTNTTGSVYTDGNTIEY
jgi:outer membrane protein TolC